MSFVDLTAITKTYKGSARPVLEDLALAVDEGEIVVLLGPSGCGKTTLLKIVAGLEAQDSGTVAIDGVVMDGIRAERRPIAMVFQKALLFRSMTVAQNIGFAPRVNKTMKKSQLTTRVDEMLRLIDMEGMGGKRATELSGGQEQRVSLARALITNPKVLLLDEPLSALDASLRESMRTAIKELNHELGTTMLFVTHDQQEAVELADRIALMHGGRILQYGPPEEFYTRPISAEVARFFGWRNFIPATKRGTVIASALGEFALADVAAPDGPVDLIIRPEAATLDPEGPVEAVLLERTNQGPFELCHVAAHNVAFDIVVRATDVPAIGSTLRLRLAPEMVWAVTSTDASPPTITSSSDNC